MHGVWHQCGCWGYSWEGGQKFQDSVPVFDTVQEAVDREGANVAAIYVPPRLLLIPFWKQSMRKFL